MIKVLLLMVISSLLFRWGGCSQWLWAKITIFGKTIYFNQKLWRRAVLPIVTGAMAYWMSFNITTALLVATAYALTLNLFAWGENAFRKVIGKYAQWFLCGFMWGGSCFVYTGWIVGLLAAIVGGLVVTFLMWWSNDAKITLDQKWVEVNTGWIIVSGFLIKEVVWILWR